MICASIFSNRPRPESFGSKKLATYIELNLFDDGTR